MNDVMQGRWTLLNVIGLVVWQKHVKSLSLSLTFRKPAAAPVPNPKHILCWALVGTQHLISLACTASGNATKDWQNLRHDKASPAIGLQLGCQSTKAKMVPISQQITAPGLIRSRSSMGRLIKSSCFRA